MKFTGTIDTWITSTGGLKFLDIVDMADGGKGDQAVSELHYVNHDMSAHGWTKVGAATITVELMNEADVNSAQMTSLKAELQEVRADNQRRENAILDRISKLGALTYKVSA
jgi:hypothetical protein